MADPYQNNITTLAKRLKPFLLGIMQTYISNVKSVVFVREGELNVWTGDIRIPNETGSDLYILRVRVDVDTAPTGSGITIDVNNSGTTIFTDQDNRPVVAAGEYSGTTTTVDVRDWAYQEYLTVDIDGVGSTVAGSDLTVTIICQ